MDDEQASFVLRLLDEDQLSAEDESAIAEGLDDLRSGQILSGDEVRDLFA
ncbi:MAG: hypothetical protein V9E83_14795 [Baekduia sp.]